jgi:hypothetical protein|eukprot:SAG25_NODE_3826_length_957_cov_0.776224_2_plen_75_part_00
MHAPIYVVVTRMLDAMCRLPAKRSASRQPVNVPAGVRLPPVKPPSRGLDAARPASQELQWDEFLTGLDEVRAPR